MLGIESRAPSIMDCNETLVLHLVRDQEFSVCKKKRAGGHLLAVAQSTDSSSWSTWVWFPVVNGFLVFSDCWLSNVILKRFLVHTRAPNREEFLADSES